MTGNVALVMANWDPEGNVWITTSHDIPGLVLSAATKQELIEKIQLAGPSLLEKNTGAIDFDVFQIQWIEQETISLRAA